MCRIVKETVPEHEALMSAVKAGLKSNIDYSKNDVGWWMLEKEPEKQEPLRPRISPVNKYSRLPNFHRSRHLRGIVRRPV